VNGARNWSVDGPCPFLTCLDTGPHEHAICPACEAVRYGNPFYCQTCCAVLNAERAANGMDLLPAPPEVPR
jgi:hypothetical protein